MALRRIWDLKERAGRDVRDDALGPDVWPAAPASPVPLRCPGCGQYVQDLAYEGLCDACEAVAGSELSEWEDGDLFDTESQLDPADLVREGILGVTELLWGAPGVQRLNRRLPPDSLDWEDWVGGDELYFFFGACRGCGRTMHFQESWDTCARCSRRNLGTLWSAPLS